VGVGVASRRHYKEAHMGDKGMGGGKQPQKGGGGFGGDKKQAGGAGSKPVQTKPDFKGGGKGGKK
jgi:hypothetical protein